jgi:excisionase family DNA binding protein
MKENFSLNFAENLKELIRDVVREEIKLNMPVQTKEKLFYTTNEAADYLGISINTLYKKNRNKEISYDKQSKKAFYKKQDLDNYLFNSSKRCNSNLDIENEIKAVMMYKQSKKAV